MDTQGVAVLVDGIGVDVDELKGMRSPMNRYSRHLPFANLQVHVKERVMDTMHVQVYTARTSFNGKCGKHTEAKRF